MQAVENSLHQLRNRRHVGRKCCESPPLKVRFEVLKAVSAERGQLSRLWSSAKGCQRWR